jgi:hypothetical protein
MEAAASEQAAGGGDTVSDTLRTRVPGRVSSEVAPWQQQGGGMAGRSSSEMHPSPNNLQELQTQMRAASARDAALVAAVQQAAGTPAAATSPTAAAGQRGDSAPPGLLGDAVEGGGDGSSYLEPSGKPISQSSSSPFLPAAQHRLSSSETGSASLSDAVQAAAAAAAAAAGQQGTGSPPHVAGWTTTDRQQPTSPHLARLNSSSTHGGQLALSVLPQQQQRLAAPMSPAAAGNSSFLTANQSLLVLRAASLQLNVSPSVLLASSDRRSMVGTPGQRRVSGPARALFPPVTILFAAVEGSGELLRYPALARWVAAVGSVGSNTSSSPCSSYTWHTTARVTLTHRPHPPALSLLLPLLSS